MPLQNFVNFRLPAIGAAWLNEVDRLKFTVFDDAATKAAARTALELNQQVVVTGVDSGVANSAVVTVNGPLAAPGYVRVTGSKVSFTAAAVNTGAATLNVNATGAAAILDQAGNACTGGELFLPVIVQWTGAAWQIIAGGISLENKRTATETSAGIVPVNYNYRPMHAFRWMSAVQIADVIARTQVQDVTTPLNNLAASVPSQGGEIILPAGSYRTTDWTIARDNIAVLGEGMSQPNSTNEALTGGTIVLGQLLIDGNNIRVEKLGVDFGITYSDAFRSGNGGNALVIHDVPLTEIKTNIVVRDVIGLIRIGDFTDPEAAFHGILLEGLRYGEADNVVGVGGWFGVVLKVSDFNIGSVRGIENDTASVYLKSNTYGPVNRVNINNAIAYNPTARGFVGVLIEADDAELSTVTVGNISVTGGGAPVRINAVTAQPAVNVTLGDVACRSAETGVSIIGPCFGISIDNINVDDPSTGEGFSVQANGVPTSPVDVTVGTLRVNADNTHTGDDQINIAASATKVAFGLIVATTSFSVPGRIKINAVTTIGQYIGVLSGSRTQANLLNGWAVFVGGQACGIEARSGYTQGYGRIDATAATSDIFMTLPASMHPSNLAFMTAMTGFLGATGLPTPVYVAVAANGDLSISPNRAAYAGTVSYFDLTTLIFPTEVPATGGV